MNTTCKIILGGGLALAAVLPSRAALVPFSADFDGAPSGTPVNVLLPSGITFEFAQFVPDVDSFGDPILGTEHWEAQPGAPSVLAENPAGFGYGAAPSPSNALNALDGAVLLTFSSPIDFSSFSTVLDNAVFGSLAPVSVDFFDSGNALLASYPIDETVPGLVFTSGALNGVSKVVLPGGAFYDNVSVVPEPGAFVSVLGGMGILLGLRRRA